MAIKRNNDFGSVNVSKEAIATLVGGVVAESYGIVGMASQKIFKDGLAELLGKENYSKGIVINEKDNKFELDIYIIVGFGVKISQVIREVQKKVKYEMERCLDLDVESINVYVQGVKVNE